MIKVIAIILLSAISWLPAICAERTTLDRAIRNLDHALDNRQDYISKRQNRIDSLKAIQRQRPSVEGLIEIGNLYSSFVNDSAMVYYADAYQRSQNPSLKLSAKLKYLSIVPLSGSFESAVNEYLAITDIPANLKTLYYESGRKMYSYIASSFGENQGQLHKQYLNKAIEAQHALLELLPNDGIDYLYNLGELYYLSGENTRAKALLRNVTERTNDRSLLARANHHLAGISRQDGKNEEYRYHLACSAVADIESATLEVISLQELGAVLYADGDIDRAYRYLTTALDNAVRCGASLRMVESSRVLPIISKSYNNQARSWRKSIYFILAILVIILMILAGTLIILYHKVENLKTLQQSLRHANKSKDIYINQFLKLCSIYMDKLNQFCKMAQRKISAGKTDELYQMTKSGKFIEEQSSEFYEVFDNAFLHLYPNFVDEVNKLLLPEHQIVLENRRTLNTDIRILAISRMGIEDSASIAQILNYSINTIYAYRNRLKSRAINRESFEEDIMKIDYEQ